MERALTEPEVVDLLEVFQPETNGPFKASAGALRAYLALDRAERRRRDAVRARQAVFRRSLAAADIAAFCAVFLIGAVVLGAAQLTFAKLAALALLILAMKAIGLYDRDELLLHKTTLDELPLLFQVATLTAFLLWLAGGPIVNGLGRLQALGFWMLLCLLLVVGRSVARHLATTFTNPERCLLIGDSDAGEILSRKLSLGGSVSAEVVGRIPISQVENGSRRGPVPTLPQTLYRILAEKQIDRVILAPGRVDSDALLHTIRELQAMEVSVSVLPDTPPVAGSSVELDHLHGLTLLGVRGLKIGRSSHLLKRAFDIIAASLMLLFCFPLLLAITIAIKLDSPGPILFRQRRVGRKSKQFEILKFRSMHAGSETRREEFRELSDADGLFKIERDPRVTTVGKVIRRWSLDELPQLINVLRGEMSLVGPRPLVPDEDSLIKGFYRRRLDLTPGITGYWQALGSSRIPLDEMIQLDFLYIANWSLWNDARILLRTVPYVVGRQGR